MGVGKSFASIMLLCIGCGQSLPVAPVSGTITIDGQPLAGATITTQPIATDTQNPGPGSFGHTDDQGHYELELVQPARKGAIIGQHRVMISRANAAEASSSPQRAAGSDVEFWTDDPRGNRRPTGPTWPTRFSDGSLQLEVPVEGTEQANFNLTTKS
jgi:hypothetical protein